MWSDFKTAGLRKILVSHPLSDVCAILSSASMEVDASIYKPLDFTRREIRLLWIQSSEDDFGHIRCSLNTISLTHGPFQVYVAVSYE
jgi:hypothetical protein